MGGVIFAILALLSVNFFWGGGGGGGGDSINGQFLYLMFLSKCLVVQRKTKLDKL